MLKVIVVAGGFSKEREVSLVTGKEIYKNLNRKKYNVSFYDLKDISGLKYFKQFTDSKDLLIFNALHGTFGEDGLFQKYLDNLNITYTGCGFKSSSICMNKVKTKKVFEKIVLTPKYMVWSESEESKMPFSKCVVKPVSQGSSVGVSIVDNVNDLKIAIERAKKLGKSVMIEEFIKGTEVSVPVLGNMTNAKCLPVIEIIPLKGESFYSYTSKYEDGGSKHIIPARFDKKLYKTIHKTALLVYKKLLCEVYARVDMIIKDEKVFVLEVNTLPGMTPTSLFPQSADNAGIPFARLLDEIIELSLLKRSL